MSDVVLWFLSIEFLGVLGFPFAFSILPYFRDRGFALAKPLGLVIVSYIVWVVGSCGIPVSRSGLFLVLLSTSVVSMVLLWKQREEIKAFCRSQWRLLLALEGVFLTTFLFWVIFRSFDPMINHTEQLMDFGLLNAATRALTFPPEDPWLQGYTIDYYYFGFLILGLLSKITNIPTAISYNLGLATVPALASLTICALVYTLVSRLGGSFRQSLAFGFLGIIVLGFLGNLEGGLEILRALGLGDQQFWNTVGIKGLDVSGASSSWFPSEPWWWWRATRVVDTIKHGVSLDYTIIEFPAFSYILGDLHAHVISTPFLLVFLALALQFWATTDNFRRPDFSRQLGLVLAMAIVLGAIGFINAWTLPTLMGGTIGMIFLKMFYRRDNQRWKSFGNAAGVGAVLVLLPIGLYAGYYVNLSGMSQGILPMQGYGTRLFHFLIVWGVFLAFLLPFYAYQLTQQSKNWQRRIVGTGFGLALLPFVLWLAIWVFIGADQGLMSKTLHIFPLVILLGFSVVFLINAVTARGSASRIFILGLLVFGWVLLLLPELVYVVDSFENRMNTVFKLSYQAWAVFAVVSAVALYEVWIAGGSQLHRRMVAIPWGIVIVAVLLVSVYYTSVALVHKASDTAYGPTLDGLAFLKDNNTGEYEVIQWLLTDSVDGDVLLEAVGSDYSDYGRMSASTGIPTALGWPGHQIQWRDNVTMVQERQGDVARIYSGDPRAKELVGRYMVRYIIVGPRERYSYGAINLEPLGSLIDSAFSTGEYVVHKVNRQNE